MKSMLRIGDKQIVVNHPAGTTLTMEGGRLEIENPSHRSLETQLDEAMQKEGIQWGDAIAWITHQMGIKQCAPCKRRQYILNHANKIGIKETIKQIKETFSGGK